MIECKGVRWVGLHQLCLRGYSTLVLALGRAQWYSLYAAPSAEVSVSEYCNGPQCPTLKVSTMVTKAIGVLNVEGYLGPPVHILPHEAESWLKASLLAPYLTCGCHIQQLWQLSLRCT